MEIFAARAVVFAVARVCGGRGSDRDKARSANGGFGEVDLEADADLG